MTIAQQLNIKDFPFEIKDKRGKEIYSEYSNGYWYKKEYDANGNPIYYENSNGGWVKWEYDAQGNQIHYEDSRGQIVDKRVKEYTMDQIAKLLNVDVKDLKIKK